MGNIRAKAILIVVGALEYSQRRLLKYLRMIWLFWERLGSIKIALAPLGYLAMTGAV